MVDLLAWFSDEERSLCPYCGERTAVTIPAAFAEFCLDCGAVSVDGVRIGVDGRSST